MSLQKLTTALNNLESHLENHKISNPKISKESVAWQIDHSLKVINNVTHALKASDPETYKNNFSLLGKVLFKLSFFPRGKAKAPKQVLPPEIITKDDLIEQIQLAKTNIKTLSNLDKNAYFKHSLFGNINTKRIHRFLMIHTNHHLKIIKDLVK